MFLHYLAVRAEYAGSLAASGCPNTPNTPHSSRGDLDGRIIITVTLHTPFFKFEIYRENTS
jgi:hypothetical protein